MFEAFEEVDEVGVVDIVYEWKCHHKFLEIPKLFQDTPDHNVDNYEDLKLFNESLDKLSKLVYEFVGKELFDALPITKSFESNFEMVAVCLTEIETKVQSLRDSAAKQKANEMESRLPHYQSQVARINEVLTELRTDSLCFFGERLNVARPIWKHAAHEIKIAKDGLECSKSGSCSYSVCAAEIGWKCGAHTWYIRADQISCYDTIGICDDTFFNQTQPLLVGLGTYPGSHRTKDGQGIKYCGTRIMTVGTLFKCTLDLGKAWKFTVEVIPKSDDMIAEFPLKDYYKRGVKLYPAVVLCNASKYTLVDMSKTKGKTDEEVLKVAKARGKPRRRRSPKKKQAKKKVSYSSSDSADKVQEEEEPIDDLFG